VGRNGKAGALTKNGAGVHGAHDVLFFFLFILYKYIGASCCSSCGYSLWLCSKQDRLYLIKRTDAVVYFSCWRVQAVMYAELSDRECLQELVKQVIGVV
jgi:hypothetical protein